VWGLQFWVALPLACERADPAFFHHGVEALPTLAPEGARVRVVLGEAFGVRSPVVTPSPMFLVDARLEAGARLAAGITAVERAAYVVDGAVRGGAARERVEAGHLAWFDEDEPIVLEAVDAPAHVVLLGGPPLDAPRFLWWNFVSSSRDAILDAQAAWTDQPSAQFPQVPGENEHIPLPSRPAPPAPTAL
jgi:hypothetical protein